MAPTATRARRATGTALEAAIDARGLSKAYPSGVQALDGLGFRVEPGRVFALLGPNGAGKSTTVRILTTLSHPDEGEAWVAGFDVRREPDRVRRAIGYVAQRSGIDADATGRENLRLQGRVHGLGGRDLERRIDELLARFGLADAADRLARTYSGGMQRRLDLAMGLIHRPSVLFLDEPTSGLDPEARADVWREIEVLSSEQGLTVLLTTHYLEEADRLASRLAIVDRGRIVVEGTPEELKGELRGDALNVELAEAPPVQRVRDALQPVGGVHDVVVDGFLLRARADHGATAVPAVLAALDAARLPVVSVAVARPSLDDVYLRHAGRTYAVAQGEDHR
jgi:ABC-2 type transport system ATP-binding protein